ncbi:MAG: dihydroorotase [Pseudomonadota bacterium]
MQITIPRPDDWHLHLRDEEMMTSVSVETARDFGRAIVMPNLIPPVLTGRDAAAYRDRILAATKGHDFMPLMTLYLTEHTDPSDLAAAHASGIVTAGKLYPAGATTNSADGVRDVTAIMPLLEKMAEIGCPLCIHGEVTDDDVDLFDREAVFVDTVLDPLRKRLPELRIILEHLSSKEAVQYVGDAEDNLAGTITVHHMSLNRDNILAGGIKPDYYCMPIVKGEEHRRAVRAAATSGSPKYFLGTDSAPHLMSNKYRATGAPGIFTASKAMPLYAHMFEADGKLENLEAFASRNGPAHYKLPVNMGTLTLEKADTPTKWPDFLDTPLGQVKMFDPLFETHWRVV